MFEAVTVFEHKSESFNYFMLFLIVLHATGVALIVCDVYNMCWT